MIGFTVHTISDPVWFSYRSGDCTKSWQGNTQIQFPHAKLGDHSYFAYLQIDEIDSFYVSVLASGAEICKVIREEAGPTIRGSSRRRSNRNVVCGDFHRLLPQIRLFKARCSGLDTLGPEP